MSNTEACRSQSAALIEKFQCQGNGEASPCLTKSQIDRTIKVYHDGYRLPYQLANEIDSYPGYNSLEGITMQLGSEPKLKHPPVSGPNAHHSSRSFEFLQNFVSKDEDFDLLSFDIHAPGSLKDRIVELSGVIGATQTDWSSFSQKGGKIIWLQGTDDPSVSPGGNAALYEAVVKKMGQETVDAFMRFYLVPGLAHGGGRFSPTWDNLTALDNWVENDVPPVAAVLIDATKSTTRGRTRPLCQYPGWARYSGSGSLDAADSFTCSSH